MSLDDQYQIIKEAKKLTDEISWFLDKNIPDTVETKYPHEVEWTILMLTQAFEWFGQGGYGDPDYGKMMMLYHHIQQSADCAKRILRAMEKETKTKNKKSRKRVTC